MKIKTLYDSSSGDPCAFIAEGHGFLYDFRSAVEHMFETLKLTGKLEDPRQVYARIERESTKPELVTCEPDEFGARQHTIAKVLS